MPKPNMRERCSPKERAIAASPEITTALGTTKQAPHAKRGQYTRCESNRSASKFHPMKAAASPTITVVTPSVLADRRAAGSTATAGRVSLTDSGGE